MIDKKFIKNALRRKRLSGADVGKVLIASLMNDYSGENRDPNLITQDDINRIVSMLSSDEEKKIYRMYYELYQFLPMAIDKRISSHYKFTSGFYRYQMYLNNVNHAEKIKNKRLEYPVILTQSQQTKIFQEIEECNRNTETTFAEIVLDLASEWSDTVNIKYAPEPIKIEMIRLDSLPATNPYFSKDPKQRVAVVLYGGKKIVISDNNELEKKIREIKDELYNKMINDHVLDELYLDYFPERSREENLIVSFFVEERRIGLDALYNEQYENERDEYYFSRKLNNSNIILKDKRITKEEMIDLAKNQLFNDLVTINYEPITDGQKITKRDGISVAIDLFKSTENTEDPSALNVEDIYREFIAEYKDLYKLICNYLKAKLNLKSIPSGNKALSVSFSFGELADSGIYYYEDLTKARIGNIILHRTYQLKKEDIDMERFELFSRIINNGVAILTETSEKNNPYVLDNGNYYEQTDLIDEIGSLSYLQKNKDQIDYIIGLRENVTLPALKELFVFNFFIEEIEKNFDLDLNDIKYSLEALRNTLHSYNFSVLESFGEICGNNKELKLNRALYRKLFQPISEDNEYLNESLSKQIAEFIKISAEQNLGNNFAFNLNKLFVRLTTERRD